MARLFFFFLVAVVAFVAAEVPVRGNNFGIMCVNQATATQLNCGYTVADVLRTTGLSLLDFALLQDNNMGYIYPSTVIVSFPFLFL